MRIRLTRAAEEELTGAIVWYEAQAPGRGAQFIAEFRQLTHRLEQNPRQFPAVHGHVRRAIFNRFPYGLFFRIHGNDIDVFACFHFSRDPSQWMRRT
jgi:plasmid stabilization system protein ParE